MTISQENISIYNPDMPDELKEETLRKNSESLGKVANNRAVNIIKNVTASTTPATTSSAYINISPEFSVGFHSNGGVIEINAPLVITSNTANSVNGVSIYLDGALRAETNFCQNGGFVRWIGLLAEGDHKMELKWKTNAGTLILGRISTFQIVEYII